MFSGREPNSQAAQEQPALEPILVDYFSRDGSTLMMRLLTTSPQIAVGGEYPYEHKYFAYLYRWARLLDRPRWPKAFWGGSHFSTLLKEKNTPFMGPPPWLPRELFGPGRGEEAISAHAFRMIWAEFSRRAAAQTRERHKASGAQVRFYAEKHLSSWRVDLETPVRLVALLRDPRDTYLSIDAFNKKRREAGVGGPLMGRAPGESDEAWVARYLPYQKQRLRWIGQALKTGDMPVFRYDDLVLDLPGQARRIEEWLGVSLDPEEVANDNRLNIHVTAGTPRSSVGRWQAEMPPELAKRFSDELGEELKELGFEVPQPRPSPRRPAAAGTQAGPQKPAVKPDAAAQVAGNGRRDPGESTPEDVARLQAALEMAAMEKDRLQRGLSETEHWLRQIENSRSWRVTRPIRAAGETFRRLSVWRAVSARRRV